MQEEKPKTESCRVCGRALYSETSKAWGIGPICRGKVGIPRGTRPDSFRGKRSKGRKPRGRKLSPDQLELFAQEAET